MPPKACQRGDTLPGEIAFKLYDTYGFPFDLTEDALKARGIGVDAKGFAAAMERQRAEARKSWAGSGEAATETLWFELKEEVGATEFLGYDDGGRVRRDRGTGQGRQARLRVESRRARRVIVNQTPFYGESGGQVGDRGLTHPAPQAPASRSRTPRRSCTACSCMTARSRSAR